MSNLVLAIRARIYRDGLAAILSSSPGVTIVAAEADAAGAIAAIESLRPDVVLADTTLEGALELVSLASETSSPRKVIALAVRADDNDHDLLKWAEAGAVGFVTCDNSVDELLASMPTAKCAR